MTPEEYLAIVRSLRDDYSEEIPSKILHSTHCEGGPMFKVRKAWIDLVGAVLENGVRYEILPEGYITKMNDFYEHYEKTGYPRRDTTREDIDYANRVLDEIIGEVSKRIVS